MPEETEEKPTSRTAGVLVPLFSLRRESDLGIGDVAGLREFIDWVADCGFGFIQLLPINETGPDNSPYNAVSSVALEPLTLDCSPAALADLTDEAFQAAMAGCDANALRQGPVDYRAVRPLKHDLLWRAFARFFTDHYQAGTDRDRQFGGFCEQEKNWLGDYCLYRLLMDLEGGNQNWQTWDERYNTIAKARTYADRLLAVEPGKTERQLVFYAYVQWVAHQQWRETRDHADRAGVALMGDIPIGVSLASADVFANPGIFDLDWFGGAPPERFFKDDEFVQKWGQNWGIPLYRWDVLAERGYDWWRQRVEKIDEIFSLFRIDHTLGFYRIYAFPWNPVRNREFLPLSEEEAAERCGGRLPGFKPRPDDTEENSRANREEGETCLRMLQEAAAGAVIIAEDLGFVPDYVRPSLHSLGIPGMIIPQWEFENGSVRPGDSYEELSFATYATHDHSPLAAQWEENRVHLKESEPESDKWRDAKNFFDPLCQFAGIDPENSEDGGPPPYGDAVREKLLGALFASDSRYASVMMSDLLGTGERINVPGILDEANWTSRLGSSVKELRENPAWSYLAGRVKNRLIETGRAPHLAATGPDEAQPPQNTEP